MCSFSGWCWIKMLFISNHFQDTPRLFSIEITHFQCVEIAFRAPCFCWGGGFDVWHGGREWCLGRFPRAPNYSIFYILCHRDALARIMIPSKQHPIQTCKNGNESRRVFLLPILLFEWHTTYSMFAFKLARIIQLWLLISEGLITLTKVNQTLIFNKIATAPITCKTFITFLFPCKRMHCFHYAPLIS